MDRNNFLTILKTITESLKCPSCGNTYEINEVQFMSQYDQVCLVNLTCNHCKMPVWVNFFATDKKPEFKISMVDKSPNIELSDISSDEVISFSKFIREFDGNFIKEFKG